jgi:malate/lactate dehydrogenase
MRIALIGAGNTSSSTLLGLLSSGQEHEIILVARNSDRVLAALLDAASAFPQEAQRVRIGQSQDIKNCDIVLVCAGAQITLGETAKDVLNKNAAIAIDYLKGKICDHTYVVLIGTPVDDLTSLIINAGIADKERVIGFGGDLDTARLRYILAQEKITEEATAVCIGEHGSRTIPVYESEKNYDHITSKVRSLLKSITTKAGPPRNLATGVWLSKLALALTQRDPCPHNVCAYIPEFEICLTWPRMLSSSGIISTQQIHRSSKAEQAFSSLLVQKRNEQADLLLLGRELSAAN